MGISLEPNFSLTAHSNFENNVGSYKDIVIENRNESVDSPEGIGELCSLSGSGEVMSEFDRQVTPPNLHIKMDQSIFWCDAETELFMIHIEVNEYVSCEALVDTGASHSLVQSPIVDDIQCEVNTAVKYRIFGLSDRDGDCFNSVGQCNLSLRVCEIDMNSHPFIVIPPNHKLPCSVVLGVDFLQANRLQVDAANRSLSISSEHMNMEMLFDKDGIPETRIIREVKCFSAKTVLVKEGEVQNIPISFSIPDQKLKYTSGPLFHDGILPGKISKRVVCLAGVGDCDTPPSLMIANKGSGNLIFHAGMPVGSMKTAVEVETEDSVTYPWSADSLRMAVKIDHLTDEQQFEVITMLEENSQSLSMNDFDIGRIDATPHRIQLYNETPIYQRPRRFAAPIAEEIEKQCNELEQLGIIEESSSPWSAPVVPITKKDGSLRLCVDYRALNRATIPDKFPIPNIVDSVFGLHGVKYFTKLDLVRGYYQVPLHEDSKKLTAFSTPHGHWQFNVLSFGLKNAPAAFQRGMQHILRDFSWKNVIVYVDDILIMETSFDKHLKLVWQVLSTLANHGVKIKLSKCEWFQSQVEFLGHTVSTSGVRKTEEYIKKVVEFPRPQTVKQLQEFLGLINFQRKFVKSCSEIQKPLSALTAGKGSTQLQWTTEMIESFNQLKDRMRQDIELAFPDYSPEASKLELWVDASEIGAGACLTQVQDNKLCIIAFQSMTFGGAQKNYSVLEKELAAMRWGVKIFKAFLYGVEFVIHTDHQPLLYLNNMRLIDSRLARTLEDLADFNFETKYTPGSLNTAADALSRIKPIIENESVDSTSTVGGLPRGFRIAGDLVPGGPDSLFDALHVCLGGATNIEYGSCSPVLLREVLVEELLAHPNKYRLQLNRKSRKTLKLMKLPGQLPAMEVLLAASHLYKLNIHVYFDDSSPVVFSASGDINCDMVVNMQCLGGIHFNPLVPVESCSHEVSKINCMFTALNREHTSSFFPCSRECIHKISARPTIIVKYENKYFCAVLDSGAQVSLVGEEVIQSLSEGLPHNHSMCRIFDITGSVVCVEFSVSMCLNITPEWRCPESSFGIVKSSSMGCCFLLGMDFLSKAGITIDMDKRKCKRTAHPIVSVDLMSQQENYINPKVCCIQVLTSSFEKICVGIPNEDLIFRLVWSNNTLVKIQGLFTDDSIMKLQNRDKQLRSLRACICGSVNLQSWPKNLSYFKRYHKDLILLNGILMKGDEQECYPVIPFELMVELALVFHHKLAHIGRDKILDLLNKEVWNPKAHQVVSDVCRSCQKCQLMNITPVTVVPPTLKISTSTPFELVAVDLVEFGKTL